MRIGDTVSLKANASIVVLAFACAVVGSWTGLILIEQATAQKGKVSLCAGRNLVDEAELTRCCCCSQVADQIVYGWLTLTGVALGIGMFATVLIGATSLELEGLPTGE